MMERMFEERFVEVWGMKLYPPKGTDVATFNREIRNWLAQNISSGSWETKLGNDGGHDVYVKVTFDIEAEEDAMAAKLRWS